jgi:hypothetical protein
MAPRIDILVPLPATVRLFFNLPFDWCGSMNIHYCPDSADPQRRARAYGGDLLILPPCSSTLALVDFARELIEEAFSPLDPRQAHENLEVSKAVDALVRLKPYFIHHPRTRTLLQRVLLDVGCNPDQTYQDVPRLRVAYPKDYLTSGIAYAHHPHRDTWYSAPSCQLNWWMPLYDFEAEQGLAFHPQYFDRPIVNSSAEFNYYRWNAEGRKNAGQHVKSDTRKQPQAGEPLELSPDVRLVVPTGGVILFSAQHLHSTVANETCLARWSIDFRTVNLEDLIHRRGAAAVDAACTGTSIRDFRRVHDFEPMPERAVTMYDDAPEVDGVPVYQPVDDKNLKHQRAETR